MSSPADVLAVLGELHGEAVVRRIVQPRQKPLDDEPGLQVQPLHLLDHVGPKIGFRRGGHAPHCRQPPGRLRAPIRLGMGAIATLAWVCIGHSADAEDLTFSFDRDNHDAVESVIWLTKGIVGEYGYKLHQRRKLTIRRRHQSQRVTGLVVNDHVSLPRRTRRMLLRRRAPPGHRPSDLDEPAAVCRGDTPCNTLWTQRPSRGRAGRQPRRGWMEAPGATPRLHGTNYQRELRT